MLESRPENWLINSQVKKYCYETQVVLLVEGAGCKIYIYVTFAFWIINTAKSRHQTEEWQGSLDQFMHYAFSYWNFNRGKKQL